MEVVPTSTSNIASPPGTGVIWRASGNNSSSSLDDEGAHVTLSPLHPSFQGTGEITVPGFYEIKVCTQHSKRTVPSPIRSQLIHVDQLHLIYINERDGINFISNSQQREHTLKMQIHLYLGVNDDSGSTWTRIFPREDRSQVDDSIALFPHHSLSRIGTFAYSPVLTFVLRHLQCHFKFVPKMEDLEEEFIIERSGDLTSLQPFCSMPFKCSYPGTWTLSVKSSRTILKKTTFTASLVHFMDEAKLEKALSTQRIRAINVEDAKNFDDDPNNLCPKAPTFEGEEKLESYHHHGLSTTEDLVQTPESAKVKITVIRHGYIYKYIYYYPPYMCPSSPLLYYY